MRKFLLLLIAVSFLVMGNAQLEKAQAGIRQDTVQTIYFDRGDPAEAVMQRYILIEVDNAVGTVILFMGGQGILYLVTWESHGYLHISNTNFLVRTRHHFAAEGFNVVVIDAASDFWELDKGLIGQRTSAAHLSDIAAVINDLPSSLEGDPGPICLVGTSRGTISAGAYAAEAPSDPDLPDIDCLVLTSSLTQQPDNPTGHQNLLDDVQLELVNVPTYVVAHEKDGCYVTPPSDVMVLKSLLSVGSPKVGVKTFCGGTTPLSGECNALSAHGFFGIEPRVVGDIGKWVRKQIGE
jgi:dienelactone hydrolase